MISEPKPKRKQNHTLIPYFLFWRSLHWLVVSLKLGMFWKRVRLLVTFLQPSSDLLCSAADRICSTLQSWQQLSWIASSAIFLNLRSSFSSVALHSLIEPWVGGSSQTAAQKGFKGKSNLERNQNQHFPGKKILCVNCHSSYISGYFLINKCWLISLALKAGVGCLG